MVIAPTDRPRGMCAEVENHMRTGESGPNRGGSVTRPRFEISEVSEASGPRQRTAGRSRRRLTATGSRALATAARAGSTCGPGWSLACRVCPATSGDQVAAAGPSGSAVTVPSRERLPSRRRHRAGARRAAR